jgi:hypothetical protein
MSCSINWYNDMIVYVDDSCHFDIVRSFQLCFRGVLKCFWSYLRWKILGMKGSLEVKKSWKCCFAVWKVRVGEREANFPTSLVFCLESSRRRTRSRGRKIGGKKGQNTIVGAWRTWFEDWKTWIEAWVQDWSPNSTTLFMYFISIFFAPLVIMNC